MCRYGTSHIFYLAILCKQPLQWLYGSVELLIKSTSNFSDLILEAVEYGIK